MTTLTALGQEHLEMLPRHLHSSTDVRSVIDALAREAERYLTLTQETGDQLFVNTATWGLSLWERRVGIKVWDDDDPDLPTDAVRRQAILTKLLSNRAVSGAEFRAVIDRYTTSYSMRMIHTGLGEGTLEITLAFDGDSEEAIILESVLDAIIPAHLNVNVQYEGFIAGVSMAGDSL